MPPALWCQTVRLRPVSWHAARCTPRWGHIVLTQDGPGEARIFAYGRRRGRDAPESPPDRAGLALAVRPVEGWGSAGRGALVATLRPLSPEAVQQATALRCRDQRGAAWRSGSQDLQSCRKSRGIGRRRRRRTRPAARGLESESERVRPCPLQTA